MSDGHVLIVDDDALVRRVLRRVVALARPAAHVYEAQSVAQALRIVATAQLDLVITDVHLPDGLGFQVLAAVRKQHPGCPIFVISGDRDAAAAAAEAGAAGFLAKPLDVAVLLHIIEQRLNARSNTF